MTSLLLTIDVAHPPRGPQEVEDELLQAWNAVRNSPSVRILKIIHGYGRSGKGGSTKETVRNWLFLNRNKFRQIMEGEGYNMYAGEVQEMRRETGEYPDADLNSGNAGITVVWVK